MIINASVVLLTSLISVCYFIRKIIYIAHKKRLFDEPSELRKIHSESTPNLGGVAIFISMIFACIAFVPQFQIKTLHILFAAALFLFSLGLADDLVGVNPTKKIFAQLAVALIVTVLSNHRITDLYGIFGVHQIPYFVSVLVSTILILLLVNAFNLIDGINALAGSLGLLASISFAVFFWYIQDMGYLYLSLGLAGSLSGFLLYNRTPARIFMGDTGSLFLGFLMSIFSIQLLEASVSIHSKGFLSVAPPMVFAIVVLPVFDTLRVFLLRIMKGGSPFKADRQHIHHQLINLNISHLQATAILLVVNLVSIALALVFNSLPVEMVLLIILGFNSLAYAMLWFIKSRLARSIEYRHSMMTQEEPQRGIEIVLNKSAFSRKREVMEAVKES